MAVMDEFREEREAMKHGTPKEKLEYFWLYYKWHVIVAVAAIIAISSFIRHYVTLKENVLYALFLNCHEINEEGAGAYIQDFTEIAGINTDENEVMLDTSIYMQTDSTDVMNELTYATIQKIQVYVAAGQVDLLAANQATFEYYAYQDFLYDLRNILTPEQIERYSPYFFYIDKEVLAAKHEASYSFEEINITYPDPTKPEEMAEPIPVGIFMNNVSEEFNNNYVFLSDTTPAIGFIGSGKHLDNAMAFLEYIFTAAE